MLINESNIDALDYVDDVLVSFHEISERKKEIFLKVKEKGVFLHSCTILTRENIEILEKYYEYMKYSPVDEWFLLRQVPNKMNKEPLNREDMAAAIKKVTKLNQKYKMDVGIANSVPFCVTEECEAALICVGGRNDSGHTRLLVDSKGGIYTDYLSDTKIGTVDDNIIDIWLSLNDIRNMNYLPDKCRACRYKVKCKGGLYLDYLR
jgi:radical SAM protein with 4Fe4S-binding SPASM domain